MGVDKRESAYEKESEINNNSVCKKKNEVIFMRVCFCVRKREREREYMYVRVCVQTIEKEGIRLYDLVGGRTIGKERNAAKSGKER